MNQSTSGAVIVCITTLVLLLLPGCGKETEEEKVNLILISIDTLRPDRLGTYGADRETSPTIDWLAETGVLFEQAYSQAPKTAPSHMSILTGLYPESHGVRNWREETNKKLPDGIPTLASILREDGYTTRAYTGHGHMRAELGFDKGFNVYESGGGAFSIFSQGIKTVKEFAKSSETRPPFFLFLHTYAVHDPYVAPLFYHSNFVSPSYKGKIPGTREDLVRAAGTEWGDQQKAYWGNVDRENQADVAHLKNLYDAAIRFTDDQISRLVNAIRDVGLEENTMIVFLSDHGEEFLEHENFLHDTLYQEVLHVPLILKFAGKMKAMYKGRRIQHTVRLIDVLPTVLAALDVKVPSHLQGTSLVSLLDGTETTTRNVFSQWPAAQKFSLRKGSFKLIRKNDKESGGLIEELYELKKDPSETNNLLGDESQEASALRAELDEIRKKASAVAKPFGEGGTVKLSDQTKKELEALGYLKKGEPERKKGTEQDGEDERQD